MPDLLQVEVSDKAPANWHSCFRPLASNVRSPGNSHVAWHPQGKGDFFGVVYSSENEGNLEVKWIKGRLPPSEVKWANW